MDIIRKDATIENTSDEGPGTFEVILSAPTLDRDGETLHADEWKQPLPDHITFDSDHGMSVATTVGSGVPRIDEETGNMVVAGTYSSLPRAQEVRTLVNEGHIRTTSVAFMTEKTQKDGKEATVRELLNGAFVAIPSNREALVLASKGVKAGARNSAGDLAGLQTIHDTATSLGADCSGAKSIDAERLLLAKAALVATGYFTEDQIGDDIAPRITELFSVTKSLVPGSSGEVAPDEDGSSDPAPVSAAAPAKAAAPAETQAADDDELQTRVRALNLSASIYAD
jgi:hypothetical protein